MKKLFFYFLISISIIACNDDSEILTIEENITEINLQINTQENNQENTQENTPLTSTEIEKLFNFKTTSTDTSKATIPVAPPCANTGFINVTIVWTGLAHPVASNSEAVRNSVRQSFENTYGKDSDELIIDIFKETWSINLDNVDPSVLNEDNAFCQSKAVDVAIMNNQNTARPRPGNNCNFCRTKK